MKKFLMAGFASVLFLSACSGEETADNQTEETAEPAEESAATGDVKRELMNFYLSISQTINQHDANLNAFELGQAEGTLPEGEELQAMKDAAKQSAEETGEAVGAIEVPEALSGQQEDLEGAISSIQESYAMKAEALESETPSFDAATEKFGEADETLNALLEEQGLVPSNLYNEVSQ